MAADNETIVHDFCAAWSRKDLDELISFFAPDAVYHNMPMQPVQGTAAIREMFNMFAAPAERITFELLAIASSGNLVFTERLDRFRLMGRDVALPAAGVFELRAGKITAWRDYFDMQTWLNQTGQG